MNKKTHSQEFFQNITVTAATKEDSNDIWHWRNDQQTQLMSLNTDSVGWDLHSAWYSKLLDDQNRSLYVGRLSNNEKIGICRFDVDTKKQVAEVSINLNPLYRGKNLSSKFLSLAIEAFLKAKKMNLVATIKKKMQTALNASLKVGLRFTMKTMNAPVTGIQIILRI